MAIKPKSFKDIMEDMTGSILTTSKVEDLHAGSAMKSLLEALETDMYYGGCPTHERGLRKLLGKFGVKSAKWDGGGLFGGAPLQMEGLDATLRQVSFDIDKLKLWKDTKLP